MFEAKQIRVCLPKSPALRRTRNPRYCREVVCLLISLVFIGQIFATWQYCKFTLIINNQESNIANSTLGFGRIYVVSRQESRRRNSLLSAAALTKLEIDIPLQPIWTDQDVASIQAPERSSLNRGSTLAWLGHRNALESFLKDGTETALIMEDDVDWDVRIRTQQIPQTAYAIRELLGSRSDGHYYGNPDLWDIIWLGHCGDFFNATRGSQIPSIKSYKDTTMPDIDDLHPWTRDFLHEIGAHDSQQRLVHASVRPLCTFAYAITRTAARKILKDLAVSEPIRDLSHPCTAYDVRLLEGCREEGLRCITVNPELFHHNDLDSEIAKVTENRDEEDTVFNSPMVGSATNIRCSARSSKWNDLRNSISEDIIDADEVVRDIAQLSADCYIDDL